MIKHYIQAARLRTLPLSVSGIIVGSFLANFRIYNHPEDYYITECWVGCQHFYTDFSIFWLAILTTIGLQVLSNFANDYGDGVKGTDNEDRIGPERALQSGAISPKQMLNAIKVTGIITFCLALLLIYVSFGKENFWYSILFLVLGIASIVAAIKYTMGKNAYGYSGLGDVFVFIFFGLLSVCGSYFLYTKYFDYTILLPAVSIGLLSSGVLNLNNMRDRESDAKSNKNTLVVKIGVASAKKYHYSLLIIPFLCAVTYILIRPNSPFDIIFVIAFIPIFKHLHTVYKNEHPKDLDSELKKLAISTFLFAILFGIGQVL
ncbi:MAG: 1,4-dihydroxy-2-naphthoate octaprenyltransferase [Flavobacteriales bacterium]|jgi:1,4-dihydroxy-2-naphthoate octaprenyltransferase|tara:strand:- start:3269 stop:4222 length:954 start_codon:yes stop_codon:yes gene_type:complete